MAIPLPPTERQEKAVWPSESVVRPRPFVASVQQLVSRPEDEYPNGTGPATGQMSPPGGGFSRRTPLSCYCGRMPASFPGLDLAVSRHRHCAYLEQAITPKGLKQYDG
jgi:hypothetical protein